MPQREIKSFLVINPFGIGDVLFSMPLIRNIKNAYPHAQCYYVCNRRTQTLLANNPLIHKTFIYERDEFEAIKIESKRVWLQAFYAFIQQIRKEKIAVAFDLSLHSLFSVIALCAGIKQRIGFNYRHRGFLLTQKIPFSGYGSMFVADHILQLLTFVKIKAERVPLEVYYSEPSKKWAQVYFDEHMISSNDIVIGISPCGGASWGKDAYRKQWAPKKYAALMNQILNKYNVKLLLFGSDAEADVIKKIFYSVHRSDVCHTITGYSLDNVAALIDRCSVFVGNDGGLLHIACALGKKIVGIYGPVDEEVYGMYPYDATKHIHVTHEIACRPCYKNFRYPQCDFNNACLGDIPVDEVFAHIVYLIERKTPA